MTDVKWGTYPLRTGRTKTALSCSRDSYYIFFFLSLSLFRRFLYFSRNPYAQKRGIWKIWSRNDDRGGRYNGRAEREGGGLRKTLNEYSVGINPQGGNGFTIAEWERAKWCQERIFFRTFVSPSRFEWLLERREGLQSFYGTSHFVTCASFHWIYPSSRPLYLFQSFLLYKISPFPLSKSWSKLNRTPHTNSPLLSHFPSAAWFSPRSY